MWIAKIGFSDKKVLMRILFTICYVLLYQFIWVEYCCDNFDYYGFTMIEYDFFEDSFVVPSVIRFTDNDQGIYNEKGICITQHTDASHSS